MAPSFPTAKRSTWPSSVDRASGWLAKEPPWLSQSPTHCEPFACRDQIAPSPPSPNRKKELSAAYCAAVSVVGQTVPRQAEGGLVVLGKVVGVPNKSVVADGWGESLSSPPPSPLPLPLPSPLPLPLSFLELIQATSQRSVLIIDNVTIHGGKRLSP